MEAVDSLIGTFTDDFGRAVAHGAARAIRRCETRLWRALLTRLRAAQCAPRWAASATLRWASWTRRALSWSRRVAQQRQRSRSLCQCVCVFALFADARHRRLARRSRRSASALRRSGRASAPSWTGRGRRVACVRAFARFRAAPRVRLAGPLFAALTRALRRSCTSAATATPRCAAQLRLRWLTLHRPALRLLTLPLTPSRRAARLPPPSPPPPTRRRRRRPCRTPRRPAGRSREAPRLRALRPPPPPPSSPSADCRAPPSRWPPAKPSTRRQALGTPSRRCRCRAATAQPPQPAGVAAAEAPRCMRWAAAAAVHPQTAARRCLPAVPRGGQSQRWAHRACGMLPRRCATRSSSSAATTAPRRWRRRRPSRPMSTRQEASGDP